MDRWKCPMNWSTDIPARPGWYRWRNRAKGHAPALVEVKVDEHWFLKSGPPAYFVEVSLVQDLDEGWAERTEWPS
jgi:hypothetical protein